MNEKNWINEELTRISSVPKEYFAAMKEGEFNITIDLGRLCLAFRHLREKASAGGLTPKGWDRVIAKLFPTHSVEKINLYVSAGHVLYWDMELVNKFQSLVPPEIINFGGTPVEPMRDQLKRLGLFDRVKFEVWAQTNEDAQQQAEREAEEAKIREERAERAKAAADRQAEEQRARDTKALHEAEIHRLAAEKEDLDRQAFEARTQSEVAETIAEAERLDRQARSLEEAVRAKAEEVVKAEEAAKAAEGLDPKYERMLDKLIAQSQGFHKMELLFQQVATAIDLLPRKKVEALKRNMSSVARIAEQLLK